MTTNVKLISEKLRNNTLMSTLTISIEHSTGSLSHSNQARGKKKKSIHIEKEEVKVFLIAEYAIIYMENYCNLIAK